MPDKKDSFGARIKRRREALGWTQGDLAEACHWPRTAQNRISNYELDERFPKNPEIRAIAKALGCSVGELFGEDPKSGISLDEHELVILYRKLPKEQKEVMRSMITVLIGKNTQKR